MNAASDIRGRFERRVVLLYFVAFLFLLLLMLRLADLQLFQYEGLFLQGEHNRINVLPILPTRGEIVDRFGKGLAVNRVSYRATIIPERVPDMGQTLNEVAGILQWKDRQLIRVKKSLVNKRADRPVLIANRLTWGQAAPLSAHLHRLPGVDVQAGTHRYYPHSALTSHLIGYLSSANAQDIEQGFLSIEKVGRSGAEKTFEYRLHGKPGAQYEEIDALGRRVSVLRQTPPVMGNRVSLSLDLDMQEAAALALGDRTGAVVVMDIHTGEVLTLLSQPGFDSNKFILGLEEEQWRAWLEDERRPLLNRATQSVYPPASTFKLLVGIAGLKYHLPLVDHTVFCPGYLTVGKTTFHCWKKTGHGRKNLHDAIVQSCDVYFYNLGKQLGIDRLRSEAVEWGFGRPTGIQLQSEAAGLAPGFGRKWFMGDTIIASIGQGRISATPLQLARFAAAIANGGLLLKPQLEKGKPPEVVQRMEISPEHLNRIRKAMRDVVANHHGTAHATLSHLPWKVAAKTGTAQVIALPQNKKKEHATVDWHKDHAWLIGFAPYEDPRIAFAVLVEHGGHGGSAAGPVAAAIIQAAAGKY